MKLLNGKLTIVSGFNILILLIFIFLIGGYGYSLLKNKTLSFSLDKQKALYDKLLEIQASTEESLSYIKQQFEINKQALKSYMDKVSTLTNQYNQINSSMLEQINNLPLSSLSKYNCNKNPNHYPTKIDKKIGKIQINSIKEAFCKAKGECK